jgi:hypothetical protein
MSPQPDDFPNPPFFGELGESPEEFEGRRIRAAELAVKLLNEEQAKIPMREDFGSTEQESWDTPEMTRSAIADMKASRAPARVRAGLEPLVSALREDQLHPPSSALAEGLPREMALMVRTVIGELGRGLQQQFADLREDLAANTALLGVMNAPLEAITDSHERASHSFETLRREIADISGTGSSPAIEALTKVIDTAGLSEAQSRAERRFEELAKAIEGALTATRIEFKASIDAVATSMVQVLHLLERLQARELREAKRRAGEVQR